MAPSVPPSISPDLLGAEVGLYGAHLHSHTPEGSCEPGAPTSCQQRTGCPPGTFGTLLGAFPGASGGVWMRAPLCRARGTGVTLNTPAHTAEQNSGGFNLVPSPGMESDRTRTKRLTPWAARWAADGEENHRAGSE